ncbi:hypothetical protein [Candidatus Lokiarchaeum ossiferum]
MLEQRDFAFLARPFRGCPIRKHPDSDQFQGQTQFLQRCANNPLGSI